MGTHVGTIKELWRYPVKSMSGERRDALEVEPRGAVGDRLWAVRDEQTGELTSAKKLPGLMLLGARFAEEPRPGEAPDRVPAVLVRFPDGSEIASGAADLDARISNHVGRRVRLVPLAPARDAAHYRARQATTAELRQIFGVGPDEPLPDLSSLPLPLLAELGRFATPRGTYFDCYPLHVLTTASLEAMGAHAPGTDFDVRRFRPNLLVETGAPGALVENAWCGGTLHAGDLDVRIETRTVRCSMPSRAQAGVAADPRVMKTIARHAERHLGAYASVAKAGRVRVGDRVMVEMPSRSMLRELVRAVGLRGKRLLLRAAVKVLPGS